MLYLLTAMSSKQQDVIVLKGMLIWATTSENVPSYKIQISLCIWIRIFIGRILDSLRRSFTCGQWRLPSDCTDVQADLNQPAYPRSLIKVGWRMCYVFSCCASSYKHFRGIVNYLTCYLNNYCKTMMVVPHEPFFHFQMDYTGAQ